MNWRQVCERERELYFSRRAVDRFEGIWKFTNIQKYDPQTHRIGQYTLNIMNLSREFCKILFTHLPRNPKILDFGGSDEPWFSILASENGGQVYTIDMFPPALPELIYEKRITYIHDDMNNLGKYSNELSGLDLLFCRNISPPQKLANWYDPDFVQLWKTMVLLLKDDSGFIYWIQMGNGTGIPDSQASAIKLPFINHTAGYFCEFFSKLGVDFRITKYGYMAFKVANNLKLKQYHVGSIDKREDLSKDYPSLIKWYAYQLQEFYEATSYDLNNTIEIRANDVHAKILRILLLDNFRYHDAVIVREEDPSKVRAGNNEFILSNVGPKQDSYFMIDEQEDKRFTGEYLQMLKSQM